MSRTDTDLANILATDDPSLHILHALLQARQLDEAHLRRITGLDRGALRRRLDPLADEGLVRACPQRSRLLGWAPARDARFRLTERGRRLFAAGLIRGHLRARRGWEELVSPFATPRPSAGHEPDPREDEMANPEGRRRVTRAVESPESPERSPVHEHTGTAPTRPRLPESTLELCVLALLEHEDSYGYELTGRLTSFGVFTYTRNVYPLLNRLERDGLVEVYRGRHTRGAPRKYYRLLPAGRSRLAEHDRRWVSLRRALSEWLEHSRARNGGAPGRHPPASYLVFEESDARMIEELKEFARGRGVSPEQAALAVVRWAMTVYGHQRPEANDPYRKGAG